jgi:hypothetical protein
MDSHQWLTRPGGGGQRTSTDASKRPFGHWQDAGNRAIAGLLAKPLQRDIDADDGASSTSATTDDATRVDEMAQSLLDMVDGAAVAELFRTDASGQASGRAAASADDSAVQSLRIDRLVLQRDPPTPDPTPAKPADLSDLLDAVLALSAVSALLERLAEKAVTEMRKAGAPASITLGVFVLPPLLVGLNQGLGVKKLVLKTPEIQLGRDSQGVQRSVKFRLEATVDPTSGGGGSLGAEFKF